MHHEHMEYIPAMKGWLNIKKSIYVITILKAKKEKLYQLMRIRITQNSTWIHNF